MKCKYLDVLATTSVLEFVVDCVVNRTVSHLFICHLLSYTGSGVKEYP